LITSKAPAPKLLITTNTTWNLVNFRSGLIAALVSRGFDVVAVAPDDAYRDRLRELGCRYVPLNMDNQGTHPVKDALLLWRYFVVLRRERPAVILSYTVKPNIYASLAARLVGVTLINNVSGLGTAFLRGGWLGGVVCSLYRVALRRSHRVFFQNDEDRQVFIEKRLVAPARTGLLPGSGIDLVHFSPSAVEGSSLCNGAGLVFLMVARLLWDKGVLEFVEAARRVKALFPESRFQLLGFLDVKNQTAVGRSDVEAWVKEGVVEYLGTSDDVRPFLAAADCVVLPSYREGTPRSLLEAAAMGRPLLATDVPGCREVVIDGVNGLLCRLRDSVDLAEKMMQMITMPMSALLQMGQESRRLAETRFDEQIVINKYLEAIDEVTGR